MAPAQGDLLCPALSVAQASGKEDWASYTTASAACRHPDRLTKLVDGTGRVAQSRGELFSFTVLSPSQQASAACGKDSKGPQGSRMLLPCPLPFLMRKPTSWNSFIHSSVPVASCHPRDKSKLSLDCVSEVCLHRRHTFLPSCYIPSNKNQDI